MTRRLATALLLIAATTSRAEDIVFPKDAGILNVKDFGAKGDGLKDDTAAIQKALDKDTGGGRIVYLPAGTYRVSDGLKWPQGKGDHPPGPIPRKGGSPPDRCRARVRRPEGPRRR